MKREGNLGSKNALVDRNNSEQNNRIELEHNKFKGN